jgi:hypothetical protein
LTFLYTTHQDYWAGELVDLKSPARSRYLANALQWFGWTCIADRLAHAVSDHATPVGSGTVARTKRIPVEERAEAAVIAWLRHKTTAYDSMAIPRIKGKRREIRRRLARRSQKLLDRYRRGEPVGEDCPLKKAMAGDDYHRTFTGNPKNMAARRRAKGVVRGD